MFISAWRVASTVEAKRPSKDMSSYLDYEPRLRTSGYQRVVVVEPQEEIEKP